MSTIRVNYKDDKEKYQSILDVLISDVELKLKTITSLSTVFTAFVIGFLGSLVLPQISVLIEYFSGFLSALISLFIPGLSSLINGDFYNFFLIVASFAAYLLLFLLFTKFIILVYKFVQTSKSLQKIVGEYTQMVYVTDILTAHDKLLLAKLFPEEWDILLEIDEVKKNIKFVDIEKIKK